MVNLESWDLEHLESSGLEKNYVMFFKYSLISGPEYSGEISVETGK